MNVFTSTVTMRYLPLGVAAGMITLLELLIAYDDYFWWWFTGLVVLVMGASLLFAHLNRRKIHRLKYLILPALLLVGGLLFLVLLQTPIFRHLFSVILVLAYLVQFYNMLELHKDPLAERRKSILQFFDALTFFTAFLLYVGLWQLTLFFNLTPWMAVGAAATITGILAYQLLWYHRHFHRRAWSFVLVIALTVAEITWTLLFWPTGYFVNATILLVTFYLFGALSLAHIRDKLTKRVLWQYLGVAVFVIGIVLLTSAWGPPDYGF